MKAKTIKHLLIISGMSGSGKSVAIDCLADHGYYCIDNMPPSLIMPLIEQAKQNFIEYMAIVVDIRSTDLNDVPAYIDDLKENYAVDVLFLDADDDVLLRRFSETRRKHPFSHFELEGTQDLRACLKHERLYLSKLQEIAYSLDTSHIRANQLRQWLSDFLASRVDNRMTLTIQSFGFKHNLPKDCDFIFDVRYLSNPYYETELRPLTGLDAGIINFFKEDKIAQETIIDIFKFIEKRLPLFQKEARAYLNIGIGCTGGQHRSVYIAQALAHLLASYQPIIRHRCISQHQLYG